jgi:hypothetical protein
VRDNVLTLAAFLVWAAAQPAGAVLGVTRRPYRNPIAVYAALALGRAEDTVAVTHDRVRVPGRLLGSRTTDVPLDRDLGALLWALDDGAPVEAPITREEVLAIAGVVPDGDPRTGRIAPELRARYAAATTGTRLGDRLPPA